MSSEKACYIKQTSKPFFKSQHRHGQSLITWSYPTYEFCSKNSLVDLLVAYLFYPRKNTYLGRENLYIGFLMAREATFDLEIKAMFLTANLTSVLKTISIYVDTYQASTTSKRPTYLSFGT